MRDLMHENLSMNQDLSTLRLYKFVEFSKKINQQVAVRDCCSMDRNEVKGG